MSNIKPKPKPCKGTTNDTKGYGCGEHTLHRVYGLCKMKCYPDWLLNTEPGRLKLEKATLKATKPRRDLEQAAKERKEKNSLGWLLENVKNACHKYIRKRDSGLPCISCGQEWKPSFQAGHFYKAELYSNLKYDEDNVHGQCQKCNLRDEGNESGYRVGLLKRHGQEFLNALDKKAEEYKKENFKWDREELKKIRTEYNIKYKKLG